jgi:hypothetical protein
VVETNSQLKRAGCGDCRLLGAENSALLPLRWWRWARDDAGCRGYLPSRRGDSNRTAGEFTGDPAVVNMHFIMK